MEKQKEETDLLSIFQYGARFDPIDLKKRLIQAMQEKKIAPVDLESAIRTYPDGHSFEIYILGKENTEKRIFELEFDKYVCQLDIDFSDDISFNL